MITFSQCVFRRADPDFELLSLYDKFPPSRVHPLNDLVHSVFLIVPAARVVAIGRFDIDCVLDTGSIA